MCSTWCLMVCYAFCFGVELTMNNIITPYFLDNFEISLTLAGLCGATFGLMNLFSRSLGGLTSDGLAKRFGMRGRLGTLLACQMSHFASAVDACYLVLPCRAFACCSLCTCCLTSQIL